MYLSKRGSVWYIWIVDEVTGKKRKISTHTSNKSAALIELAKFVNTISPQKTASEGSNGIPRYEYFYVITGDTWDLPNSTAEIREHCWRLGPASDYSSTC